MNQTQALRFERGIRKRYAALDALARSVFDLIARGRAAAEIEATYQLIDA